MVAQSKVNIADVARRSQRKVETAAHEVTQDLAEAVIERTPVRTGFLRGSWFVAINDREAISEGTEDKGGSQTVGRMSAQISQSQVGDIIYMLNGASYAKYVENGTRYMRPRNFVKSTVNDAPQIAEETILRIAKT